MTVTFDERRMGRSFRLGVRLCRIMIALGCCCCCSFCGAGIWMAIVVSLVHWCCLFCGFSLLRFPGVGVGGRRVGGPENGRQLKKTGELPGPQNTPNTEDRVFKTGS